MSYIIDRKRTPLLDAELRDLVDRTLDYYLGKPSTPAQVRMVLSLLAFEHGAGADGSAPSTGRMAWHLWCNNYGNRRGGFGNLGQYQDTAEEIIKGKAQLMTGAWPAWSTPSMGFLSWCEKMAEKFPEAWDLILAGTTDTMVFAQALKKRGYYTTTIKRYEAGIRTWYRIMQKWGW